MLEGSAFEKRPVLFLQTITDRRFD